MLINLENSKIFKSFRNRARLLNKKIKERIFSECFNDFDLIQNSNLNLQNIHNNEYDFLRKNKNNSIIDLLELNTIKAEIRDATEDMDINAKSIIKTDYKHFKEMIDFESKINLEDQKNSNNTRHKPNSNQWKNNSNNNLENDYLLFLFKIIYNKENDNEIQHLNEQRENTSPTFFTDLNSLEDKKDISNEFFLKTNKANNSFVLKNIKTSTNINKNNYKKRNENNNGKKIFQKSMLNKKRELVDNSKEFLKKIKNNSYQNEKEVFSEIVTTNNEENGDYLQLVLDSDDNLKELRGNNKVIKNLKNNKKSISKSNLNLDNENRSAHFKELLLIKNNSLYNKTAGFAGTPIIFKSVISPHNNNNPYATSEKEGNKRDNRGECFTRKNCRKSIIYKQVEHI